METVWQINLINRSEHLSKSGKFPDCRFLVGTSPNQCLIAGHRLLLAMASPVFECMFYGSLPEKNDPIVIPDVQPDAFKAMLIYIYTDEITISTFENACQLYYVAKKYMLPHVVKHCTNFLLANLSAKNACRVYGFANFYEEPFLMESSMELIATYTQEVITEPSFMDIEGSTLMAILDKNNLNIDSEMDLFNCLLKLAKEHGILYDEDKDNTTDTGSNSEAISLSTGTCGNVADEVIEVDSVVSASASGGESAGNVFSSMDEDVLRHAVKKIRFLTMTPQQFAMGPARSKLLKQNESLAILIKMLSPIFHNWPMPEGFCVLSTRHRVDSPQMMCMDDYNIMLSSWDRERVCRAAKFNFLATEPLHIDIDT